jgi:DNA-binding transcriptional MerR regulator
MVKAFARFRDSQFNGVKDLAEAAEHILRILGFGHSGKGAALPNERTIRYYLTEGLLPQPTDKVGLTSVFGYEHLLRLVVIKKLQADNLPISLIKTVTVNKTVDELEAVLDETGLVPGEQPQVSFSRLPPATRSAEDSDESEFTYSASLSEIDIPEPTEQAPPKNEATSYLESLLFSKPEPPKETDVSLAPMFDFALASPSSYEPERIPFQRQRLYEIEPGVELHVADNVVSPNQSTNATMKLSLAGDSQKHTLKIHKRRQKFIIERDFEWIPVRVNGQETDFILNDNQKPNRVNVPLFAGRWGFVDDPHFQELVKTSTAARRLNFDLKIDLPLDLDGLAQVIKDIANICDAFDHGPEE